jgi:hypothetical protein
LLRKTVLSVLCVGAALVGAARGGAQTMHAPDGGSFERLQSIDVPEKPGASFSATVATSWKRRLEDGTEVTVYNRRMIARDSSGRVFQERRYFSPTGNTDQTRLQELDYYDPTRKEVTVCVPMEHRCLVHPWHRTTVDAPALPATVSLPSGVKITRESLGEKTIENLQVAGSREIITTPRLGDAEPTVKEFWYSQRLGINVVVKRFEPRGGAQDFTVEQISLTEPDARLFQPPTDFQMVPMPEGARGAGMSSAQADSGLAQPVVPN